MTIEFMIDYFRVTVHLPLGECIKLYDECFQIELGDLADLEHGAKGFKGVMGSLLGFQLKHTPGNGREYCTFEFPGKVCGSVAPEQFKDFYYLIKSKKYIKKNVTRLDLAFDNEPFSPSMFYQAILDDVNRSEKDKPVIRSLSERKSVIFISEPLKMREDNSAPGRDTCYFGERSSMRFLRVYNKRGPIRLELELKEERANLVAESLFSTNVDNWPVVAISHLRDFIDVDRPWWKEFISDTDRAYKKLQYAKDITLENSKRWLIKQVSPVLAAVSECTMGLIMLEMNQEGRKRMYKRYTPLLSAFGKARGSYERDRSQS